MLELNTFEDAIRFAIRHEEGEAEFYESLAARSPSEDQKKALLKHAEEERDHKRRLEQVMANKNLPTSKRVVPDADMKIAEMLVAEDRGRGDVGYEEALLLAAKREKRAERFYRLLATQTSHEELSGVFTFLADQEAKHGKKLEQEFDDQQREG